MQGILHRIRSYLSYSKTERRGIFFLSLILLGTLMVNLCLPLFYRQAAYDFTDFLEEANRNESNRIDLVLSEKSDLSRNKKNQAASDLKPFPFDPNGLPAEKWKELGLNDGQIRNIINFQAHGGRFTKKEDLAKIYSISPDEYKVLEPFIIIENEKDKETISKTRAMQKPEYFMFDPNGLPLEKWVKLGLSEKLAHTIKNYEQKGGSFKTSGDLRKIYGMTDSLFSQLEPYISIKDTVRQTAAKKEEKKHEVLLDLNIADTLDLQQLRGIGPSFARRISGYRESLGGFCKKEQLLEVYGMDSTRYSAISGSVFVSGGPFRKININKAGIKEMTGHPYIDFYLAKSIVLQREKNGGFKNIDEIMEAELVYRELFNKISPYLSVE